MLFFLESVACRALSDQLAITLHVLYKGVTMQLYTCVRSSSLHAHVINFELPAC